MYENEMYGWEQAFILFVSIDQLKAQRMGHDYQTALGVKVLDGGGITIKHFLDDRNALEGIGSFGTAAAELLDCMKYIIK